MLRAGARELLATAVRAEISEFLAGHAHLLDDKGQQRLARHGFLPEREVLTGIGKASVQGPRVRDRGANAVGSKVRFNPSLVPSYLRKAESVEELFPRFTSKPSRQGTSARHWLGWWARMPMDCPPQQSRV